jgi:hypothetical protein
VVASACAAVLLAQSVPASPFGHDRGQDVSPTFDGWVRNPDGTYSFYFGYLNRNAAEQIHIPVGPDNTVDGGFDRGQPTYFYPSGFLEPAGLLDRDVTGRRRWWVYKVVVPKDWSPQQRLVWTLNSRGHTNRATAWLQPEYEVTADFIRQNAADGVLFNRGEFDATNQPPTVSGPTRQTVTLPETTTLTVTALDDGRPQPPAQQAGARRVSQGVRFRWILYRGPTRVRFDPETNGPFPTAPAKAETKVSFSAPGTYRLRAIASDGQLFSTHDVDVTVNASPNAQTAR